MATVAVLGGGISGLSAAYYLSRPAYSSVIKRVVLLESSSRFGGWMKTKGDGQGPRFEEGPRSIRSHGEPGRNTIELVDELGLQDEILAITRKHPAASNRFLYVNNKIQPLPKYYGIFFRQSPFSKSLLSYALKEPSVPPTTAEDESIHDFINRRFGADLAKYAVDPLCRGIFAGSSKQLSIKSCFPDLHRYEQEYGSVVKGMVKGSKGKKAEPAPSPLVQKFKKDGVQLWTLREGLEQLVRAMVRELRARPNVELLTNSPCSRLEFTEGRAKIITPNRTIDCDHVFSSIYSKDLSSALPDDHATLRDTLADIPAVDVGVVSLEYPGSVLPVNGFGHLIPSSEPSRVMGVIYDSCVFPQHDRKEGGPTTRLTCMMGGAWFEEFFGNADSVDLSILETVAMDSIREQLQITAEPNKVTSSVLKACIPQYVVGHSKKLDTLDDYIRINQLPLKLIGSSYRGVSVNDCILNAKKDADKLLAKLI